ncbi:hypothetical protein ACVIHF_000745 [Bradyrhizobium sp. USDA 4506]
MIDQAAASDLRPLLYGWSGRIRWGFDVFGCLRRLVCGGSPFWGEPRRVCRDAGSRARRFAGGPAAGGPGVHDRDTLDAAEDQRRHCRAQPSTRCSAAGPERDPGPAHHADFADRFSATSSTCPFCPLRYFFARASCFEPGQEAHRAVQTTGAGFRRRRASDCRTEDRRALRPQAAALGALHVWQLAACPVRLILSHRASMPHTRETSGIRAGF